MINKIIIGIACLITLNVAAQKADWEKVYFKYQNLPAAPVKPMATTYELSVLTDVDGTRKKLIEDRMALENSIMQTNQVLLKQNKPIIYAPVDENYYPIERKATEVESLINIQGCTKSYTAQFSIVVKFMGFEFLGNTVKSKKVKENNIDVTKYYNEITYKSKVIYQVFDANAVMVREVVVNGTNNNKTRSQTQLFNSLIDAEQWYAVSQNKKEWIEAEDNRSHQEAIAELNRQLNSDYGYTINGVRLSIATSKDNKTNKYPDFREAYQHAVMGYNYLETDKNKANEYLMKAIAIWEKALSESNITNKKARINNQYTGALLVNLILAYTFVENFEKVKEYKIRTKTIDLSGGIENRLQEIDQVSMDYQKRYAVNHIQ
jgi:hypothetical protein